MPRSVESKIRASLPIIRFLQSSLPLPLSSRLLKLGMTRVQLNAAVTCEVVTADNVACEWIIPQKSLPDRVMLYLCGLPPLLVHVGEDEILRQDTLRIAQRAKEDSVDVRLEIYLRIWHVWQLFLALPQAKQSLAAVAQFLDLHLEQGYL